MKLLSSSTALLFALVPLSASAVTINLAADTLRDANGVPLPQTGLVVLTAAAEGVFGGPTGSDFVSGGEMLLYSWDLSAVGIDGAFAGSTGDLSFSGAWNEGDQLRVYWYPTLTLGDNPADLVPYGYYSDPLGIDGSDPWITPDESANMSLSFFTSDSIFFSGTNSTEAGIANHAVPDAGNTLFLMSIGLAGLTVVRQFQQKSHSV
jgi:hypothetical protein